MKACYSILALAIGLMIGDFAQSAASPEGLEIHITPETVASGPFAVLVQPDGPSSVEVTVSAPAESISANPRSVGILLLWRAGKLLLNTPVAEESSKERVSYVFIMDRGLLPEARFVLSQRDSLGSAIRNYWFELGEFGE